MDSLAKMNRVVFIFHWLLENIVPALCFVASVIEYFCIYDMIDDEMWILQQSVMLQSKYFTVRMRQCAVLLKPCH